MECCWDGYFVGCMVLVWVDSFTRNYGMGLWGGWMKHNGVLPVGMQVYITCITCILMYWPSWLLYAALKSKFQNGLFVA
jgi:hypothetical protein